ncbi:ER membrane protein complex subunit 4 isoform X2 [Prionailurus iriomotensis]
MSRSDRGGGQGDSLYPVGYLDKQVPDTSVQETDRILVEKFVDGTMIDAEVQEPKRCWDIALGPLKQIPMNLFIMYMAGNTISIFPTMMVCMMAWRPIQALMAISATFKMLESSSQKFLQGLVYLIGNLMGLALAVYKCQSMGLLPTHASDWLAFIEPPEDGVQWWRTASVNLRKKYLVPLYQDPIYNLFMSSGSSFTYLLFT